MLAQASVAVVIEPEGVNLRGGPGTNYVSLGVIPKGAELPILGAKVNVDWLPVSYQGKLGFVLDEYVEVKAVLAPSQPSAAPLTPAQPSPSPSPAPLTASTTQPPQLRVNSPEGVNLRSGPGMDQSVITVLAHNSRVTVISKSPDGKWTQVTAGTQTGWVDSQYLAVVDATTPPVDAGPGAAGSAKYIWPVSGRSITTHFGPGHPGIDVDQYPVGGNPVVAIAAGKVTFSGGNACCSYGLYVKVEHKDGAVSLYAHLQSMDVREGQEVTQGQTLGKSGNTGFSTGAHLHFELFMSGGQVDPLGHLGR